MFKTILSLNYKLPLKITISNLKSFSMKPNRKKTLENTYSKTKVNKTKNIIGRNLSSDFHNKICKNHAIRSRTC